MACWRSDTKSTIGWVGPFSSSHLPGMSSDLVDLLEHVYLCGAQDECRLKGALIWKGRDLLCGNIPVKWRG